MSLFDGNYTVLANNFQDSRVAPWPDAQTINALKMSQIAVLLQQIVDGFLANVPNFLILKTGATLPSTPAGGAILSTDGIGLKARMVGDTLSRTLNPIKRNVKDYGAKCDGKTVTDGAITTGTAILASASAAFTSADVGKLVTVAGAGAAGANLNTTILSYQSASQVTLNANAGTTVSGATVNYGTDDRAAVQSALDQLPSGGGSVIFPSGECCLSGGLIFKVAGTRLDSDVRTYAYGLNPTGTPIGYNTKLIWLVSGLTYGISTLVNPTDTSTRLSNCEIHGLFLDGNNNVADGVLLSSTTTVVGCIVANFTSNGIHIPDFGNSILIDRCALVQNAVGLFMDGPGGSSTPMYVRNSRIRQSTSYGVQIQSAQCVEFQGCVIESNANYGAYINTPNVTYVNNIKFNTCWFENNASGNVTTDQYYITINGNAATGVVPRFIEFDNCMFSCGSGPNRRVAHLANSSDVVFRRCNFRGSGLPASYFLLDAGALRTRFEDPDFLEAVGPQTVAALVAMGSNTIFIGRDTITPAGWLMGGAMQFLNAITVNALATLNQLVVSTTAQITGAVGIGVAPPVLPVLLQVQGTNVGAPIVAYINNTDASNTSSARLRLGTPSGYWEVLHTRNNEVFSIQRDSTGTDALQIDSTANRVSLGGAAAALCALLDVQSTTLGVRFPNMTTTQKNAIANLQPGLVVFDTTLAKLCVYTGAAWQTITSA